MKTQLQISASDASLRFRPTPLASTAQTTAEKLLSGDNLPNFVSIKPGHIGSAITNLSLKGEEKEEIMKLIDFLELQAGCAA